MLRLDGPLDAPACSPGPGPTSSTVTRSCAPRVIWEGLDTPLQLVVPHVELPLEHHDWTAVAARQHAARLQDSSPRTAPAGSTWAAPRCCA